MVTVSSLASDLLPQYQNSSVLITALARDSEVGLQHVVVLDTSDGKHWLLETSKGNVLESEISLVNARLFWSLKNGFTYSDVKWDTTSRRWSIGQRKPVPWK